MLRRFFSYVPSDPFPEVPEVEPPDPNTNRDLRESFRSARRSLVALCAVSLAWSTAQFGFGEVNIDAAGITVDLKNASIPLLLGMGLLYLTGRWMLEYAMMPRHVRRWPLAQLDFRVVSVREVAGGSRKAKPLRMCVWYGRSPMDVADQRLFGPGRRGKALAITGLPSLSQ